MIHDFLSAASRAITPTLCQSTIRNVQRRAFHASRFRHHASLLCSFLFLIALLPSSLNSATLPSGFSEQDIGGTWNEAVGLTFDETGRMYVWERAGRVWIVDNGVKLASPLIDIHD